MILRVALASLRRRSGQLALIAVAVLVAAGTVSTLAGFSARSSGRMGASLAAFGPNLTVRPQVGGPESLPPAALARVREVAGVRTAQAVSGRIDVRAEPARLDEVARDIESRVEGIEARPLLKVSESDARVTRRLTGLLFALSAVSLLLALISVGASTAALLGERRTEVGLLLALGYTGRRIGGFLAAELLAAAVLAGMAGQVLGDLAAGALADRLLGPGDPGSGSAILWSGFSASAAASATASAAVAALVVGFSLFLALRRIERLDAARVLRGD